ncbi:hypothetical protein DFP72DRAFT_1054569 [Ephemerocybe angulata]|uniref:Uncharacterized protein n=1 Tax=Ephemerocybe angulata TaxID=980116 RepID=A0A8H6H7M1_9AGAR|nr:hypothetical protein DFP72DRAFT_1054569 [Tulosesus angulatus]
MTSPPPSTTSDTDAFRFGDLAEDIARLILEKVTEEHPATGWACARVCKGIQAWVEPVLYSHIYVDTIRTMNLLHRTILSHPSKESSFFLKNVKSLALNSGCSYSCDAIVDILDACANIERLRMKARFTVIRPINNRDCPPSNRLCAQPAWNRLRPKYLEIQDDLFWWSGRRNHHFRTVGENANPFLTDVTHLVLKLSPSDLRPIHVWSWGTLRQLMSLTHLCIQPAFGEEWIPLIVPHLPSALLVCVVFLRLFEHPGSHASSASMIEECIRADPRVVAALHGDEYLWWIQDANTILRFDNPKETGMITDDDFWQRAEKMVELRGEKTGLEEGMKDLTI